jgi:hypothetical protein
MTGYVRVDAFVTQIWVTNGSMWALRSLCVGSLGWWFGFHGSVLMQRDTFDLSASGQHFGSKWMSWRRRLTCVWIISMVKFNNTVFLCATFDFGMFNEFFYKRLQYSTLQDFSILRCRDRYEFPLLWTKHLRKPTTYTWLKISACRKPLVARFAHSSCSDSVDGTPTRLRRIWNDSTQRFSSELPRPVDGRHTNEKYPCVLPPFLNASHSHLLFLLKISRMSSRSSVGTLGNTKKQEGNLCTVYIDTDGERIWHRTLGVK